MIAGFSLIPAVSEGSPSQTQQIASAMASLPEEQHATLKLLVVIANYGSKNDAYLSRVLSEYRSMPYHTDVVVLSNLKKDLGSDVETIVVRPRGDHWTMPFEHRRIFAERQNAYDLFIYTEDDMLVTQRNVEAFLRASSIVSADELVGFFQFEVGPDRGLFFPGVHHHFRWLPDSLKTVGDHTFAHFSNEHSACYLLTRSQLKSAIASNGFLVEPHQNRYDLLVTAATDPYTQCGFKKLLCLSHFEDFLVAHLPNRYVGTQMGLDASEFYRQTEALLDSASSNRGRETPLLQPETKVFHCHWSKDYYEPCRNDLLSLLPGDARAVLSIGCGWGETEAALVKKGVRTVGIALDSVIAACAKARGVEVICGDLDVALAKLAGQQFDGVLISGILHLLPDPAGAVFKAGSLLSEQGVLVANIPNLSRLPLLWKRLRYPTRYRHLGDHSRSGINKISRRRARQLFSKAGLRVQELVETVSPSWQRIADLAPRIARPLFSSEFVIFGRKSTTRKK